MEGRRMAGIEPTKVRNVCFVGHSGSGKTSLADTLLFEAGASPRKGSTADGTSVFDFEEEERQKRMTINSAVAYLDWKEHLINIVDAPGYLDFIGEMICGMSAVETVLLCVDLSSGVKVTTRKVWDMAEEFGLGRCIVLTKVDQNPSDIEKVISELKSVFGESVVPFFLFDGGSVTPLLPKPESVSEGVEAKVTEVLEKVVETDEELMEKYLGGEEPSVEELGVALREAVRRRQITPLLISSATEGMGIKELLDFLVFGCPAADAPPQRRALKGEETVDVTINRNAPFLAQVFKIVTDPYVGKLSYLRVYSGGIGTGDVFFNPRTGRSERIGNLYKVMGKEQKSVERVSAGELCAISKVEEMAIGDTLCLQDNVVEFERISFPEPMVMYAIVPKTRSDEEKVSGALQRLAEEDPTFTARWEAETGELVIRGNSTLHLEMMIRRMKRCFGLEVDTKLPKIPYRETIMAKGEGHYKHKKQTGGRGQYGEVYLRVEPLERGAGYEFVDAVVGGVIPKQFIPSVEKGVQKALKKGVVAGYPVQDVKVTVYDGSHHSVDSDDNSFRIAGERAFYDGLEKARPVLLEPIVDIEVVAPMKYMGDITGDLNSRRARITGMDTLGDYQIIRAKVPLAEVVTYSTQLRSITGGEGSYTTTFSHYDILPPNIAQQVMEKVKKEKEEEK